MRVPAHAPLHQPVTFKGVRMPLGEAVARADPNETRRLRNGRVITLQQAVDALDGWEKRSGRRLAHLAPRAPVPQPTQARLAGSRQELSSELAHRRSLAATRWQAIIDRPAGSPRAFLPADTRFPDGGPVVAMSDSGRSTQAGRPSQPRPGKLHPAKEPFEEVWMKTWGDPASVAAFVTASMGNDFLLDDRAGPSAGCVGIVQAGGWLLGGMREIARVYAGAGATSHQIQGAARVYLVGQAVPVWHQEGAFPLPKLERSYSTPTASAPVAVIEPIELDVALYGKGTALVKGEVQPHIVPGHDFGCQVVLTPELRAQATGEARVEPMPGIKEALSFLFGDMSAGLDARLTILDLSLPAQLGLSVRTDGRNGALLGLDQTASLSFNADMLAGELVAWLEIDLNDLWDFVASIFGVSGTQRREFTLHEWPGDHAQIELASVQNSIPLVP